MWLVAWASPDPDPAPAAGHHPSLPTAGMPARSGGYQSHRATSGTTAGRRGVALPVPLIAQYLNRYGILADKIRITDRHTASGGSETWIALTLSATDNPVALQARNSCIPLQEVTRIAARRLAARLCEMGWTAGIAGPDDVPSLVARSDRGTWRAVVREKPYAPADYIAVYQINVDERLIAELRTCFVAAGGPPLCCAWPTGLS